MANNSTGNMPQSGILILGLVTSNKANLRPKKDGTGLLVIVTHEIATQPGFVEYTRFFTVGASQEVKVDGDKVTQFPMLPELKPIRLKVLNWRADERRKKFIVTEAEVYPGE